MQTARPPSHAFEHGRRGQIRRCLRKITSTIRGGGKDATLNTSIPQPTAETHEHSHDDALFDFSNIITADEPPTFDQGLDQSRPESGTRQFTGSTETFHIDRFSVYQERAQKLRSRYGVNVAGNSCSAFPSTARRVQKSARMRVHRSCHMCGVDFGHGVLCRACHHRVCDDCPRAPGRRIQDAMGQAKELPLHLAADHPSSDSDSSPTRSPVMTQLNQMPSHGARTLNYSALSARPKSSDGVGHLLEVDDEAFDNSPALLTRAVRHGTDTGLIPFVPRANRHVPYTVRDPIIKVPAGVQRVYRKPRQRVRFTCHLCRTPFDNHVRVCGRCFHDRCHECRDTPSRKAEPDARLIEAVNARLAAIGKL